MCVFGSCFLCKCNFCTNKRKIIEQEKIIQEQILTLTILKELIDKHKKLNKELKTIP